ncbi:MAG TPA: zf-HC2 domain-containing protein [Streptosporangiaceae bacterium]
MNHLGRWLSALVDGELDGTERDRVLNHIAGCAACRREANAMRALKRRLTALGDSCAESPITGRLIELASDDEEIAGPMRSGATSWSAAACDPPPGRGARQIRPGWKIATGSATSALLAIGVSAFLLGNGSGEPPVPKITPSVDSYLLQHSFDAGQLPAGSTPASGVAAAGSQAANAQYWTHQMTSARLDPRSPQTVRLGLLADPAGSVAGSTPSAGSVASALASASPSTSASASPAATAPASHDRSPHKHPASRSTK